MRWGIIAAALALSTVAGAEPEVTSYDSPAAAVRALVAATKPRVVAFGELHELKSATVARSSLRAFTEELVDELARAGAGDLIVETWVTAGDCGKSETTAVAAVEKTTDRPASTESELVTLLKRAKGAGLAPQILQLSCAEYASLQPDGKLDAVRLLQLVNDKLRERIVALLGKRPPARPIVVYGGALHNDLYPIAALAPYTFGRDVARRTRDRYLEIDLYVPELATNDARESATRPVQAYVEAAAKADAAGRTIVVRRGRGSYVVFLPRALPPSERPSATGAPRIE